MIRLNYKAFLSLTYKGPMEGFNDDQYPASVDCSRSYRDGLQAPSFEIENEADLHRI